MMALDPRMIADFGEADGFSGPSIQLCLSKVG
jgi:hypothetical protein